MSIKARERRRRRAAIRHAKQLRHQRRLRRRSERNLRFAGKKRRTQRRRWARPSWANAKAIDAIYAKARRLTLRTGILHNVDHIVPINGFRVCGLHVETNLRVMVAKANFDKGNYFNSDDFCLTVGIPLS